MNKIRLTIILTLLAGLCTEAYGQVTIGSDIPPNKGALLDLKQEKKDDGSANSSKGLLLPRVNLTNPTDITTDITGVTAADKDAHIGLTVYNLNKCFDIGSGKGGPGVYVWSGTQWEYLGKAQDIKAQDIQGATLGLSSSLYGTTDASGNLRIDIPSGLDARKPPILPFNLTVNSDPLASLGTITNTYNGGIAFSATPSWATGLLTANPTVYSGLQATDMSGLTNIATTNPWQTRQTVLSFSGKAGCSPVTDVNRTVTLNQTNYKLVASTSNATLPNATTYVTAPVVFRNTTPANIYIHGNVQWKAAPSDVGNFSAVLGATYTTSDSSPAGADKSDNGKVQPQFTYTVAAGGTGTKYKTVDMVFSDINTPKRAPDVTVSFMQCQGTEDLSGIPDAASDPSVWTGVLRHPEKKNPAYMDPTQTPNEPENIYEEFYSADFGAAGRWMTTNLAAWKYDGIYHSQDPSGNATTGSGSPRTLTGPNANSGNPYNTAYWCYPNGGSGGSTATYYNNNPHLGLLYTWDAATAGKGGANGQQNTTNEGAMPETTTNESSKQQRIPGICPAGWHLPSDYEWTELENVIITNTTDYASVSDNIFQKPDDLLPQDNNSTGPRGTHGQAMKEICGVNSTNPNGLSKNLANNGFNVLLACYAYGGNTYQFGRNAYFWSSSSYNSTSAWDRTLGDNIATVFRGGTFRYNLFPVRCKKDE